MAEACEAATRAAQLGQKSEKEQRRVDEQPGDGGHSGAAPSLTCDLAAFADMGEGDTQHSSDEADGDMFENAVSFLPNRWKDNDEVTDLPGLGCDSGDVVLSASLGARRPRGVLRHHLRRRCMNNTEPGLDAIEATWDFSAPNININRQSIDLVENTENENHGTIC